MCRNVTFLGGAEIILVRLRHSELCLDLTFLHVVEINGDGHVLASCVKT